MGGDQRAAVQQSLGEPMVARGVALGFPTRRDLRHIDHRVHTRLAGRLHEVRGGLHQTRGDGVVEVGRTHPDRRGADRGKVQQIALHDFGAQFTQPVRALVDAVHQRADAKTTFPQQPHGVRPGVAGGAGDQEQLLAFRHGRRPFLVDLNCADLHDLPLITDLDVCPA